MLLSPTIFAWRKLVIWYNEYSNFCNDFFVRLQIRRLVWASAMAAKNA